MRFLSWITLTFCLAMTAHAAPSQMRLTNQFGEISNNIVTGSAMPIVQGSSNIVSFAGSTAPVDGTTGDNFAAKGSLYFAIDTGVAYRNTGTITAPVWAAIPTGGASSVLTTPLTGFSATSGSLSASDTILQAFNKLNGNASPSLTFDHSVGAKTVKVITTGNLVSLTVPAGAFADGLGTAVASTALAAGFRPAYAVTASIVVINNGTTRAAGQVVVGTDGILTLSVLGTGFTNAAAGGWDAFSISYSL